MSSDREKALEQFDDFFERFETSRFTRRNPDGSESRFRIYEITVDPVDRGERRVMISGFIAETISLGFREVSSPVVVQGIGFRDTRGRQPLTAIYFFLEEPAE